jgi:hypothetical protein
MFSLQTLVQGYFLLFPCTVCQNLFTPLDLSEYFLLFLCQEVSCPLYIYHYLCQHMLSSPIIKICSSLLFVRKFFLSHLNCQDVLYTLGYVLSTVCQDVVSVPSISHDMVSLSSTSMSGYVLDSSSVCLSRSYSLL